jgi:hypothetical protein
VGAWAEFNERERSGTARHGARGLAEVGVERGQEERDKRRRRGLLGTQQRRGLAWKSQRGTWEASGEVA